VGAFSALVEETLDPLDEPLDEPFPLLATPDPLLDPLLLLELTETLLPLLDPLLEEVTMMVPAGQTTSVTSTHFSALEEVEATPLSFSALDEVTLTPLLLLPLLPPLLLLVTLLPLLPPLLVLLVVLDPLVVEPPLLTVTTTEEPLVTVVVVVVVVLLLPLVVDPLLTFEGMPASEVLPPHPAPSNPRSVRRRITFCFRALPEVVSVVDVVVVSQSYVAYPEA